MSFLNGPLSIHDDQAAIVRQADNYKTFSFRQILTLQRPMVELLNRWTYRRFGFRPLVWHLENVILHAIAVLILFFLIRRLGWPHPVWITTAFALHPIQAHSWAYVTGRAGILASMFLFTAALVYLGRWPIFATLPALLALCCREDSIVFLIWLPFLERFR